MRWLFKKIFQWSDPDGKEVIKAIRDDCLADVITKVILSITENPKKWHDYVDNPKMDATILFELIDVKKYLQEPRRYTVVRPQDNDDNRRKD